MTNDVTSLPIVRYSDLEPGDLCVLVTPTEIYSGGHIKDCITGESLRLLTFVEFGAHGFMRNYVYWFIEPSSCMPCYRYGDSDNACDELRLASACAEFVGASSCYG